MRAGTLFVLLGILGCGKYRDFTLPAQPGGSSVTWHWEARREPVITRGAKGGWDAVDVLNPSVIRRGNTYYNFFSGYDGATWRTGLALSGDGISWHKQGEILEAGNGSAISDGNSILYYYQAGDPVQISMARSQTGTQWQRGQKPVLATGPYGSWDERGVADPDVIRTGQNYYMFYLGMDRARRQRLGLAMSEDGAKWYKLRSNPILELGDYGTFDANGLGEPAVWASHAFYWMLYTGRDRNEIRRLGLARSLDGVRWEKLPTVIAGDEAWDSKVLCDPTVLVNGDQVTVWFGGGDVAHPDQNIDGQIGIGTLRAERTGNE